MSNCSDIWFPSELKKKAYLTFELQTLGLLLETGQQHRVREVFFDELDPDFRDLQLREDLPVFEHITVEVIDMRR